MPTTRTRTVKPSGGDYTSLAGWYAGEQADLVTLDEIRQAECYSMSDTTLANLIGSTTDATRYLRVYTPTSERHAGQWDATKYRLEGSARAYGFITQDKFVRIEGVQVKYTLSSGGGDGIFISNVSGDTRVSSCILWCVLSGTADAVFGIRPTGSTTTARIWNNVINDVVNGANATNWGVYAHEGTTYLSNNTVQNCRDGVVSASTCYAKNNLAQGCTTTGFKVVASGTFHASSTNNASDFSDAPGSNPQTGTATFVDAANDNFHLAGSDTVAKNNGADLSADANLAFSDDIDGQTRSGSWDIGADEYLAVSTGLVFNRMIG